MLNCFTQHPLIFVNKMFRSWTGAEPQHLVKVGFRTCFYYILVVLGSNSCCSIKYSQFFFQLLTSSYFCKIMWLLFLKKCFQFNNELDLMSFELVLTLHWFYFDFLWFCPDCALTLFYVVLFRGESLSRTWL